MGVCGCEVRAKFLGNEKHLKIYCLLKISVMDIRYSVFALMQALAMLLPSQPKRPTSASSVFNFLESDGGGLVQDLEQVELFN